MTWRNSWISGSKRISVYKYLRKNLIYHKYPQITIRLCQLRIIDPILLAKGHQKWTDGTSLWNGGCWYDMYYDVLCTWNLFVLYLGGWTLQNEFFQFVKTRVIWFQVICTQEVQVDQTLPPGRLFFVWSWTFRVYMYTDKTIKYIIYNRIVYNHLFKIICIEILSLSSLTCEQMTHGNPIKSTIHMQQDATLFFSHFQVFTSSVDRGETVS